MDDNYWQDCAELSPIEHTGHTREARVSWFIHHVCLYSSLFIVVSTVPPLSRPPRAKAPFPGPVLPPSPSGQGLCLGKKDLWPPRGFYRTSVDPPPSELPNPLPPLPLTKSL